MHRFRLRLAAAALAAALSPALAGTAEKAPYRDAAEVRAELVKILTCRAGHEAFRRMGYALTPLYYDQPAQPALAGWRQSKEANTFVATFDMPEPITVYGHPVRQVMMVGEGLLAVIDRDVADALSERLKLKPSEEPLARHIRTREISRQALGDGVDETVTQTVSTITSHPGKTLAGCEYKTVW